MDNNSTTILLLGRIRYLEGENAYLKDLLESWARIFSLIVRKKKEAQAEEK